MPTIIAADNFSETGATLGAEWHVTSSRGPGALIVNADGQAQTSLLPGTLALCHYTGHADGDETSNFIAETYVDVTSPYDADTGVYNGYWEWGVHFGWLDPGVWGQMILQTANHPLGWTFKYNSLTDACTIAQTNSNLSNTNIGLYTGVGWAGQETKRMRVVVENTALGPYDEGYGTINVTGAQAIQVTCYIDNLPVLGMAVPDQISVLGGLVQRALPNGGTTEGVFASALGSVDFGSTQILFDNFVKQSSALTVEPEPSCPAEPTLTTLALSGEFTGATNVISDPTYFPDATYDDQRQWFTEEKEFEAGYKATYPRHQNSRRSLSVGWSNRSTAHKDMIVTGAFSTGDTNTILQWTPPDETGSLYWQPLDHTLGIEMVAPGVFNLRAELLEVKA